MKSIKEEYIFRLYNYKNNIIWQIVVETNNPHEFAINLPHMYNKENDIFERLHYDYDYAINQCAQQCTYHKLNAWIELLKRRGKDYSA